MIPPRLRAPLAAAGAALLLLLGFPESLGLRPLRLVSDWPGEIGRALGSLLFAGHLGPIALLGLIAQLAAGLALFWLAEQVRWPKLPNGEVAARTGLQLLAGAMVTGPLADLRPELLSIGRPGGPVAILEAQSGIPSLVWALLIAALVVAGLWLLLPGKPAKVRAA
jgi:hypothetical protein